MAGGSGKGIEWMINLDARTQGATDVIQALGRTKTAADVAGAAIDRAFRSMDKLPKSMSDTGWSKGIGHLSTLTKGAMLTEREFGFVKARTSQVGAELEKLGPTAEKSGGSMFREMFKAQLLMEGLKIGAELAVHAVEKVGEVMWDAVKAAAGAERLDKVFSNMLGKGEGKETLEWLGEFAELTEFTGDQVKSLAPNLIGVGLTGNALKNAMSAAVDVAGTGTNKVEEFAAAIGSIERIARTGRVDAKVLGGLHLDPHDVAAQLGKDLGMVPEVVKKKLEEGSIKGANLLPSIYAVMIAKSGKQLGSLDLEMSQTLQARLDKLGKVPEELFKGLRNTQGFQDISDTIEKVTKLFSPSSATGKRIEEALGHTLDVIGAKIKEINWERVAGFIGDMADHIKDWVEPLSEVAGLLGTIAKLMGSFLALPTLGKDIGDWAARELHPEINQDPALKQEVIDRVGEANERAWKESGASQALAEQRGYKEANDQHSPSRVWMRLGQDTVEGLALGMESGGPRVRDAAVSVAAPPSVGDLSGTVGSSSSFNAGGVTVSVNVNVGGTSTSPEEIGREVASQVPTAILAALEQFNACAGLA
jgi:hypothetical protein